ncbi:MAG: CPBP family intramembrane metalloprotease [Thermoanaerobaculia bacterium]|nr:CPBP family intramembrane metalloprotease [Thermoanaerobaculia bacterium]
MEEASPIRREEPSEFFHPPVYHPPSGPGVALVLMVLLGFSLLFSIAGAMVFQGIAQLAGWEMSVMSGMLAPDAPPAERWQMRLLLGISQFTTFILAGWVTVRLFYPPLSASITYLQARQWPGLKTLLSGVLLILVSIPLVLYLYEINKALPLPESFRLMEEQTNDAIKGLLQMDNFTEFLANLTLIALLPAIGEELVFRGVVQQQLLRRISQPWVALVLTAIIFSFIHFQFEGFLPRLLLGLLLGWLYWRTGNFWVPVAAHFANNGAQVLGQYLYHQELSTVDLEQDMEVPWYAAAISILLIWWLMRKIGSRQ